MPAAPRVTLTVLVVVPLVIENDCAPVTAVGVATVTTAPAAPTVRESARPAMSAPDRSTVIWLAASPFAPTWKLSDELEPSSSLVPLKAVPSAMRASSVVRDDTSVVIAAREFALFESLPA